MRDHTMLEIELGWRTPFYSSQPTMWWDAWHSRDEYTFSFWLDALAIELINIQDNGAPNPIEYRGVRS